MESRLSWEEIRHYLEDRHHVLTEADFQWFVYMTMSRIVKNVDDGEYQRISVVTADGTGWNFRVRKER